MHVCIIVFFSCSTIVFNQNGQSASDMRGLFVTQILDDIFASQLQQLLGNALQEKDLEPPRSIMEVRSMLCKDVPNLKDNTYYY